MNPTFKPTALGPKIVLALISPIVLLLVAETLIRLVGVETDLARNDSFEIAVPVWLLADENWVARQRDSIDRPRGVRAEDVEWLHNFEEARHVGYKLKPNLSVAAVNPFNDIEVRKGIAFRFESNGQGFRTKELGPRTPGTARIVALGDSSTFGWGVHHTHTYPRLLEGRLSHPPAPVEVLNLGIPGYTSRHGRAVFDHYARALEPDLLVISFGGNDAHYALEPADVALQRHEGWRAGVRGALMQFATFRFLRRQLFSWWDPFTASRPGSVMHRAVPVNAYKENLQYLIEEGRAGGAESVLLSVCAPPAWSEAMGEIARVMNVPFVDALELFRRNLNHLREHRLYPAEVQYAESIYGREAMEADWRLYVTNDGCHPGLAGQSLVADALAEAVEQIDWRP